MTAQTIAVLSGCVSTLISVLTAGYMIRYHCREDDRRAGEELARSQENTRRIAELEKFHRGER